MLLDTTCFRHPPCAYYHTKLSKDDLETDSVKSALSTLKSSIEEKFDYPDMQPLTFQLYREDIPEDNDDDEPFQPEALQPEQDDIEPDVYDELLLAEPVLQHDGVYARAKIIGRKRDPNGNLIGSYNPNPLLNTRVYLASFPNGHIAEFSANLISESIYNNVSEDGSSLVKESKNTAPKNLSVSRYLAKYLINLSSRLSRRRNRKIKRNQLLSP